MLKLKLQYFGHLIYWFWERLRAEGRRRRRPQKMRWLNSLTNSTDMNLSKLREIVENRGAWSAAVHGIAKSQTQMSNWEWYILCTVGEIWFGNQLSFWKLKFASCVIIVTQNIYLWNCTESMRAQLSAAPPARSPAAVPRTLKPPESTARTLSYRNRGPGILPRWRPLTLVLLASSCSF